MEPLISKNSLRRLLESGLLSGKWSISQFNVHRPLPGQEWRPAPIFPSREFLEQHPQFIDQDFRDLESYRKHNHRGFL